MNANMNLFQKALARMMPVLREQMQPATYPDAMTPKGRYDRVGRAKTQSGATHIVNPTFKSRQILSVKPSAYRHMHMGKKAK